MRETAPSPEGPDLEHQLHSLRAGILQPIRRHAALGHGCRWDGSGCRCDPSWFGFLLRLKQKAAAPRGPRDLARAVDRQMSGHHMPFGGNLLRQPAFVQLGRERPEALRLAGGADEGDALMREELFLGTDHDLTPAMVELMRAAVAAAVAEIGPLPS